MSTSRDRYEELLRHHGTPLYVYEERTLRSRILGFVEAFGTVFGAVEVAYPYKACDLKAVCVIAAHMGLSAEVSSVDQMAMSLSIGVDPTRTIFNGPWKPPTAIADAISRGVRIHVDSPTEVDAVAQVGRSLVVPPRIALRVSTEAIGQNWSRFGLPASTLGETVGLLDAAGVSIIGVSAHIGTHVRDLSSYQELGRLLADSANIVESHTGHPVEYVDAGGGFAAGVSHGVLERPCPTPTLSEYAEALAEGLGIRAESTPLVVEPGRALVAESAILLAEVGDVRRDDISQRVVLSAGTNTMPALSVERHPIELWRDGARLDEDDELETDLLGPLCTQHDYMAVGLYLPLARIGDIVAIREAGAYSLILGNRFIYGTPTVLMEMQGGMTAVVRSSVGGLALWDSDVVPESLV